MNERARQGKIGVQSDNMFPIIKKFLYSDNEIFLREIVSNGVDAIQKLRTLSSKGEYQGTLGDTHVEVRIDGDKLIISDNGIGMTAEEIDKYINQIAISGAEEFVSKYKDDAAAIIGHFGLGFYSSFMVASKVEIYTQSYHEEAPSVRWSCEGTPEFTMEEAEKRGRGTDIILHIDEESKDYLEPQRIRTLLNKYCRFLPVPIHFGKKTEWKEGKEVETAEDYVVNDTAPLWTKTPSDLKDEDYETFYRDLYPMSEKPLFWIHLNIDYPFNLTGILYFPKFKHNMDFQKNRIQLYSNQVFVTDSVEGIVPDFLNLLHGVLDSPDIPLNVSRSYLQADHNVKKISSYITRKVSDKLTELFKEDRKQYEEKWPALDIFVKYGMLTDEKFYDKAEKILLVRNTHDELYTVEEYRDKVREQQTDKEGKLVYLYAVDREQQYSYIKGAEDKGYDVLLLDGQLDVHLISMLEEKLGTIRFVRVDSGTASSLIPKGEDNEADSDSNFSDEEQLIIDLFDRQLPTHDSKVMLSVTGAHEGESSKPLTLAQNEFMRRMKDMSALQPGNSFYGELPDSYTLHLNLDHPVVKGIAVVFAGEPEQERHTALVADRKGYEARLQMISDEIESKKDADDDTKKTLEQDRKETSDKIDEINKEIDEIYTKFGKSHKVIPQLIDLALLSSGLLRGEALDTFVTRSMGMIGK